MNAISESDDGTRTRWEARLGVGCDGARSARSGVAALLGITSEVTDYGATSVVADVELTREPSDPAVSWVALDPARPCGAFRFGDRRWRMIYRVNDGESRDEAVAETTVRARVTHAYPHTDTTRLLWASAFRLGQGQCRSYSAGRWVLAGDAAHAMGPSAGAGMMLGVLGAWRLATAATHIGLARGDWTRAFDAYESGQRDAARAVQASNALIFRNLAVRSRALGATRSVLLAAAGAVPAISRRLASEEALIGLAPTPNTTVQHLLSRTRTD